jgi:radical SAM superfamily enzyme YgiQ (UPF0313 family)
MSLLALASLLEGERPYHIVDGNLETEPVARIVALGRASPLAAIGVTVMPGPQLSEAVPDSRRLRAALPGVPIVWGGYFPTQHADTVLADPAVDFCVRGQGERAFAALVRVLAEGGDLAGIPGLSYRDGGVRHTPAAPLAPLDDLPDWPYHALPMERYLPAHYLGRRVGAHHSSFGCPFGCNFCAVVAMSGRRWTAQSAERVAGVVAHLRAAYGIDAIQFHDMDFFISEARADEVARRIAPLGVSWWALGRVDELLRYRDETWRALRRSGLRMTFSGAESGSDAVLQRMNKGGRAAASATVELVRRMREHGVVPELSFVLGTPPDPVQDALSTIEFIRTVKRANPATEIVMYVYTPVPMEGTLYAEARALGFRFPDTLDEWISGDWRAFSLRRDPRTPWLAPRARRLVRDFERVLNAYHPTVTDPRLAGGWRWVLRALSAWRYHARIYRHPLELRALHRLVRYQRPETTGF